MTDDSLADVQLASPKLEQRPASRWYRYYAGFAPEFVENMIESIADANELTILDPWVGSGTTLAAAATRGNTALGLDLNPAMVVVAKGRLLAVDSLSSLPGLTRQILKTWKKVGAGADDPLSQWFDPQTIQLLRGGVCAISTLLAQGGEHLTSEDIEAASSLASFFYVALFETIGNHLRSFRSLNPTWMKKTQLGHGYINVDQSSLASSFEAAVSRLSAHISNMGEIDSTARDRAQVHVGDSRSLTEANASVDLVLSSPPYLTRLDYVVGHLPELALLGWGPTETKALRDKMIGTPTMGGSQSNARIGESAQRLIDEISSHESYAAASYYAPNFRRYFEGMSDSMSELNRVLRADGDLVLVVQDGWFKGVPIDLASCIRDIASNYGWGQVGRKDFANVRSMVQLNPRATKTARQSRPIESVLHFRRR